MLGKSISSVNFVVAGLAKEHFAVKAVNFSLVLAPIALSSLLLRKLFQKGHYFGVFGIVFPPLRERSSAHTY
jgi:hypothetical protein